MMNPRAARATLGPPEPRRITILSLRRIFVTVSHERAVEDLPALPDRLLRVAVHAGV
jgi:hypothetical protein